MNILLLAMSTYPPVVCRTSAYYEQQYKFSYFTQLEPGSKQFFCTLNENGEKFDKVISLCTPQTLMKYDKFVEQPGIKNKINIADITPYDFFLERMIGFLKNDENAFGYENALGLPTEGYTKFQGSYSEEELASLFEYIKVNNSDAEIAQAIKKTISKIDAVALEKKYDENEIAIYLNVQGGSRTIMQIINTTLNMLKSRNYSLKMVNAIDFDRDNPQNGYAIRNVTDSYLMNDLAAAMDAFLQYGRGDMFKNYYSRYKNVRGITYAPEDTIVEAVNNISDAILLCGTDNFLKGISELKNAINKYNSSNAKKDPFFELIVNDIQSSYKQLFDIDFTKHIDLVVDWCMERQLVQQAVTILEAKTPDFVFGYGFIYGTKDDTTLRKLAEMRSAEIVEPYKFNAPIHLFINTVCLNSTDPNSTVDMTAQFDKLAEWIKKDENRAYENFTFGVYNKDDEKVSINIDLHSLWFTNSKDIYPNEATENRVNKVTDITRRFIIAYRTLCARRNKLNHGANKISMQTLKSTITELNDVLKEIKSLYSGSGLGNAKRPFFTEKDIKKAEKAIKKAKGSE